MLDQLRALGLVERVEVGQGAARFERLRSGGPTIPTERAPAAILLASPPA